MPRRSLCQIPLNRRTFHPAPDGEILRLATDEIQNRTRLLENELKVREAEAYGTRNPGH